MDAYTGFAAVYDELMDNIPYEEWGKYLIDLLNEYKNIQCHHTHSRWFIVLKQSRAA